MKKTKFFKRGFTLVETVVAAAIFAFFIGSVVAAMMADARSGSLNQRRLQASNLAREGIEWVTKNRDTDWLKGNGFKVTSTGLSASLDLNNKTYTRTITIADQSLLGGTNNAKLVTVTVSWPEDSGTKEVKATKILTDWKAI